MPRTYQKRSNNLPLFLGLFISGCLFPTFVHAEGLATGDAYDVPVLRLTLGLVLCVLLAFLAALSLKKFKGGSVNGRKKISLFNPKRGMSGHINIIETRRLSPHADVASFICDDKEYLVLLSAGHALLLNEQNLSQDSLCSEKAS